MIFPLNKMTKGSILMLLSVKQEYLNKTNNLVLISFPQIDSFVLFTPHKMILFVLN